MYDKYEAEDIGSSPAVEMLPFILFPLSRRVKALVGLPYYQLKF